MLIYRLIIVYATDRQDVKEFRKNGKGKINLKYCWVLNLVHPCFSFYSESGKQRQD